MHQQVFFYSYLTTIHVLLKVFMSEALSKIQHLQPQIRQAFLPFLKNLKCQLSRSWSQLSRALLHVRNGQKFIGDFSVTKKWSIFVERTVETGTKFVDTQPNCFVLSSIRRHLESHWLSTDDSHQGLSLQKKNRKIEKLK